MPLFRRIRLSNEYEPIGDFQRQRNVAAYRSLLLTLLVSLVVIFLIVLFWFYIISSNKINVCYLQLNQASLVHTTSDKFLSFAIDSSLLRDNKYFPLKDKRFLNLAKHLSPAYVRIGGNAADCLFFNETMPSPNSSSTFNYNPNNITNFTINGDDLISLNEFSTKAQLRLVFDLNVLIRHPNNSWDSSNAIQILSFAKEHHLDFDWQLGNEPNSFKHVFNREISGTQLAMDYKLLRTILNEYGYNSSKVFGPETNHIGDKSHNGIEYTEEFVLQSGNSVDCITWHQYYLNGRETKIDDFINVTVFDFLPNEIKNFNTIIDSTNKTIPICLSETSTAYGGGAPQLSDRFVAGFLWLDKLGYSAAAGLKIVMRQSFFGGNYAMVGPDLNPNPDWWVSVLFKEFVSEKVLDFSNQNLDANVRLYAHCTPKKSLVNRVSAITIFGVNLNKNEINLMLGGKYDKTKKLFVYITNSNSLNSRDIYLNGKILKLEKDGGLPPFNPVIYNMDEIIIVPPLSMIFIVVHETAFTACTS